jgi:hypothetical protein
MTRKEYLLLMISQFEERHMDASVWHQELARLLARRVSFAGVDDVCV